MPRVRVSPLRPCYVVLITEMRKPLKSDMYPQYWTTSIGGIIMKYSYEYKRMCVDQYRQGKWAETPAGVKEKTFHDMIRVWVRQEDACGSEVLQHKNQNREWTAEKKYEYVARVLAGESYKELAISAGIECSLLYQWVRRYRIEGYEGLTASFPTIFLSGRTWSKLRICSRRRLNGFPL